MTPLNEKDWQLAAGRIGCDVNVIKAVAEVEGGGKAFTTILGNDVPIILFEPHIFWRQLKAMSINPERHQLGNGDILYRTWGARPYPPTQAARHAQLARAAKIHREAALCSASWGRFQILGSNYALCSCKTVQEFVNGMYKSEQSQLFLLCDFLKNTGLAVFLKVKNWERFARGYNGPGYAKNKYHIKLKAAYERLN